MWNITRTEVISDGEWSKKVSLISVFKKYPSAMKYLEDLASKKQLLFVTSNTTLAGGYYRTQDGLTTYEVR